MSDSAEKANQLSARQALLKLRLAGKQKSRQKAASIPVSSQQNQWFPLSFAQQRLWFLQQLEPANPFYNVPAAIYLKGKLYISALEKALQSTFNRHDSLRATFSLSEGIPRQRIEPHLDLQLALIDLQAIPESQRLKLGHQLTATEAKRPFNLAQEVLFRPFLLRLAPQHHILLLTSHHIVCDGWSIGLILQEMSQLYRAHVVGETADLPPLPIQYVDFAMWQHQQFETKMLADKMAFWQKQVGSEPPVLQLPTDFPRPTVQSFRGQTQVFELPQLLVQTLQQFSAQHNKTLFVILLAAFKALLFRYTNQKTIIVGSPFANRNRAEVEHLVGLLANMLPLRSSFTEELSFHTLLAELHQTVLSAHIHQDAPLEKLVETLQIERNLSHMPLFQVIFSVQHDLLQSLEMPGISPSLLDVDNGTSKFDIMMLFWQRPDHLTCYIEYNSDLFFADTIKRFFHHFQQLLAQLLAYPDQPIARVPFLSLVETNQQLKLWNRTDSDYPRHQCLHQLFEAQTAKTPDAVAVQYDEVQISYEELNCRANRLAWHLQDLGIGPDIIVGLCMERSPEAIIGLLAILKAGGSYLPLDPTYPTERLQLMLADAQAPVLLTEESLLSRFSGVTASCQVLVKEDWRKILPDRSKNLPVTCLTTNLAYVIYTSGSTGRPKGVAVPHIAVNRLVFNTNYIELTSADVLAQASNMSFDAATFEIWGALLHGARLVGVGQDTLLNAQALTHQLRRQGVTTLFLTTALFNQLIWEKPEVFATLDSLLFGGEAVDPNRVRELLEAAPPQRLLHVYGPTESTTYASWHQVTDVPAQAGTVPIGGPLANTQLYVLDRYLQLVPAGASGQLFIGGDGLARGYLNHPQLTAERFIPHPFAAEPGARLYQTGDIVRLRPDGQIEFMGRDDHQVKIRGFRVELGEIEAVLEQHPAVQQCLVTVVQSTHAGNESKRLVAYVTSTRLLSASDLHAFLTARLPGYMVPTAFAILDRFPLTPNGKIDHQALPAPERHIAAPQQASGQPKNPIEKRLVAIWGQILGKKQIGIYDNFFAAGGDSILTIQIIARAREAGLQIAPKQLFQHQTIHELAQVITPLSASPVSQGPVTGEVPLTPIQQWFFGQDLAESHHFNQSFLLQAPAGLDAAALEEAVAALVSHHDALRLRFKRKASGWQQSYSEPGNSFTLPVYDVSASGAEWQTAVTAISSKLQRSFDLEHGPLLCAALFRPGGQVPDHLLIAIHHLVVDAVSWRILLEDLQTAYQQIAQGLPLELPGKTTSFQAWSTYLTQTYSQQATVRQAAGYWLSQLSGVSFALPRVHQNGRNTVADTDSVAVDLDEAQTNSLLQEAPAAYRTQINDLLLVALVETIGAWAGGSGVLVDLEGHGRETNDSDMDLSRTVGWFTTIFPVYLTGTAEQDWGQKIKSIKEQLRQVPDHGLPFGVLCYLTKGEPEAIPLADLPQAEISFNYLGQFDQIFSPESFLQLAAPSSGSMRSPSGERPYLLEVVCYVVNGRLYSEWTFSRQVHDRETITALARQFTQALQALIEHCLLPESGGFTPSDFPLANISQTTLETIVTLQKTAEIQNIYPLSPLQQGVLFHSLLTPNSGLYLEQLCFLFQGSIPAWQQAWQQVIDHHPILRTSFVWEGLKDPLQVVHTQVRCQWQHHNWQPLTPAQQEQHLQEYLQADRSQQFDLTQAPLMRFSLVQLSTDSYRFVWSFHHLLLDGWSMSLVLQDVFHAYQAIEQGRSPALKYNRPYSDYIAWISEQDEQQARLFWHAKLRGLQSATSLTNLVGRTHLPGEVYEEVELTLSASETAALRTFTHKHQITLNTLIQGAWAFLLGRYTGNKDVLYGAVVAGRPASLDTVESMVGLLINTLPLRISLPSNLSLAAWLQDLQTQIIELQQYAYSSLVDIQRWSEIPPNQPLFENIVVFENYPIDASLWENSQEMGIGDVRFLDRTNYRLMLTAVPGKQLYLRLTYDRQYLEDEIVRRLLAHLNTILRNMATHPVGPLHTYSLLSPAERNQLLHDWNQTAVSSTAPDLIQQFEAQVQQTPDAIAVVFDDQQLTYHELNGRANQLARYLPHNKPEAPIGLHLDRSLDMVISLLAVFKAGGTYLPLDPTYPTERISYILTQSGTGILITQAPLHSKLADSMAMREGLTVIELDREQDAIAGQPRHNLNRSIDGDSLAYIIYTSGSTGKPKGVEISHRALCNFLHAMQAKLNMTPHDVFLAVTTFSFDIAALELYLPLLTGARLHLISRATAANGLALRQTVQNSQATFMQGTPATWQLLLEAGWQNRRSLSILCGGEALPRSLATELLSQSPTVWNLYGPTETTIWSTAYQVSHEHDPVPIGRPLANTQCYILDSHLRPVPAGVIGELYIGGHGVARGYRHQPALTAESFIPNPFAGETGQSQPPEHNRLYRTGDHARYLPDGNIQYLGRVDHQLKIRGYRIEPGEIEAVLCQHSAVTQALVIAHHHRADNKQLIAYLVLRQTATITPGELRSYLQDYLPDYMVPTTFLFLDSFPLTPNGKINRHALPTPDQAHFAATDYVAPTSQLQQQLGDMWQEILQVEKVGIHDNFFELGGHSLLSLRLFNMLIPLYPHLAIADLFQYPTISALASYLSQNQNQDGPQAVAQAYGRVQKQREAMRRHRKTWKNLRK